MTRQTIFKPYNKVDRFNRLLMVYSPNTFANKIIFKKQHEKFCILFLELDIATNVCDQEVTFLKEGNNHKGRAKIFLNQCLGEK